MAVYENSKYTNTSALYDKNNVLILSTRERASFNSSLFEYYTVRDGDYLDTIAYDYYGSPALWWVLMDANTQLETEYDIFPGLILAIPDPEEVEALVSPDGGDEF